MTTISNTDSETFLLPIDINKYGGLAFDAEELEIRITNDYIEVSGQQEWRMCSGGADRASFQRRHVLPSHIDPNAVLCRLMDDSTTILVTAPYLSLVSKLTNHNRPTVDYVLGLDGKGIQYLKRYNTKNAKQNAKHAAKTASKVAKEQADRWLNSLIKNPAKSIATSRLFSSKQGQQNIDLVDSLLNGKLNQEVVADNKIHLDVGALMKAARKAQPKNDSKAKESQTDDDELKKGGKRKRRTRRGKRRPAESTADQQTLSTSNASPESAGTDKPATEVAEVLKTGETTAESKTEKREESKAAEQKSKEKVSVEHKDVEQKSLEKKGEQPTVEPKTVEQKKDEPKPQRQKRETSKSEKVADKKSESSGENKNEPAVHQNTITSSTDKQAKPAGQNNKDNESPKPSRSRSVPGALDDSPKIDLILNQATASGEAMVNVAGLFAKLLNGELPSTGRRPSDAPIFKKKKSDSESDAQRKPLKSSLSTQGRSSEQLSSKMEKHVVIADL